MSNQRTQKEKTLLAFRAYLDLLDTAEWLRGYMRAPLESFDLTMGGFRSAGAAVSRGGVDHTDMAAERRGCRRQTLDAIIAQLEERGWVRRMMVTLPPAEIEKSRLPKARRRKRRGGADESAS